MISEHSYALRKPWTFKLETRIKQRHLSGCVDFNMKRYFLGAFM
jgi:hypothetical protein